MASDVDIKIGATTDELDKGSAAAQAKIKQLQDNVDQMSAAFGKFGDAVKVASDSATSSLESLSKVFDGLNETVAKAGNVSPTSGLFGMITSLASRLGPAGLALAAIAGVAGGAAEAIHHMGERMLELRDQADRLGLSTDRLQQLQQAFALGGVKVKDFNDQVKKLSDEMRDLAFDDKGQFARQLDEWGVKWKLANGNIISMNDYLLKSAEILKRAADEGGGPLAAKVGEALKLSDELVKVLQKGPEAFRQLQKEALAAGGIIDHNIIEKAAKFEQEWDHATTYVTLQIEAMLYDLLPIVQEWAKKIGNYVKEAFLGWWKEVGDTWQDHLSKMAGDTASFAVRFGASATSGTGFDKLAEAMRAKISPAMKETTSDAAKMNKTIEDLNTNLGKNADNWTFVEKNLKNKFDPTAMREFQEQLDEVREKYQQLKVVEQGNVASFKETQTQMTAVLKDALAERQRAEEAIFAEEIMKYGDNAKVRATIERSFNKEMASIKLEALKLDEELLKKNTAEWESAVNGIMGAWNSQLKGLLAGTTTWAQAMKNIAADLVIKMIEEFEKLAIVKPLTAMLANSLSAPTELFSQFIKIIGGLFGPLSAGFTSFFAPVLGPAAPAAGAAAAGAEVAAAVGTVGKFETGTNYVPYTGLAMVHQGEAIIPASQNPAGGAVASSMALNLTVQAMDSADVQRFFNRFGPQIAKTLASHMNLNPSYGT